MKTNRPQWRERFVQAAQKWRENSAPASESWRWSEVRLKSAMFVMLLEHAVEKSCKWLVKTGTSWTKYGSNGSENVITAIFKKLVLMCLLHLDCAKTQSSFYLEVWLKFEIVFSFFFRFALWDLQNLGALRSCIARWNLGLWNSKDSGECWKSSYVDVNTILCARSGMESFE